MLTHAHQNRLVAATFLLASSAAPAPAPAPAPAAPAPAPAPAAPAPASAPAAHRQIDGHAFPDKVISLTWDDGPDKHTLELAAYLKTHRVSATFFVVGAWIDGLSDEPGAGTAVFESGYEFVPILGDLVALGHRVGNHTLNHVVLREAAGAKMVDHELRANQHNLDALLTNELRLFRAPGGGWGAFGQGIVDGDPYLARMIGPVAWDIDRKDWDESLHCRGPSGPFECEPSAPGGALRMKASVVAAHYVTTIEAAGRGIVLLHDRVGHVGSTYAVDVARAMVPALERRGYVFAAPVLRFSPLLVRHTEPILERSDADVWDESTVRVGDVNGDGRADLCGRASGTVTCAFSMQSTRNADDGLPRTAFRAPTRDGTSKRNARAVPPGELHLTDLTGDGQADVCVAAHGGISCAATSPAGELGPFHEWSSSHAAELHFADLDGDGKADACSRTGSGVACERNLGNRFDTATTWLVDMSDARGWSAPGQTVHLADVDGDGRADLCGRAASGVVCALSTGKAFAKLDKWSHGVDFADDAGSSRSKAYFQTIRFGDLNGDHRADVCARGLDGVVCALSTGRAFTRATVWIDAEAADAQGWSDPERAATLQLGDVNGDGRADLCGRGRDGIVCGLAP